MKPPAVQAKRERARQESIRRQIRVVLSRLCVALFMVTNDERKAAWVEETETFPDFLRQFGAEHFGDQFDVESQWEQSLCEYLTDAAHKFLSPRELKMVDLSTPRQLVEWFAAYVETMLKRSELVWGSRHLSVEAVEKSMGTLQEWMDRRESAHLEPG